MAYDAEGKVIPMLSGRTYDSLRYFVQYILPGSGTLYFTIASIWGLPYAEKIVGTLAAVALFLSLIIGISKRSYNASEAKYDGALVVVQQGPTKVFSLNLNTDPEDLEKKLQVVLRVDAQVQGFND